MIMYQETPDDAGSQVEVNVEGVTFKVCKSTLTEQSRYFHKVLTGDSHTVVFIDGMKPSVFAAILRWFQTSQITFQEENFGDVFTAADLLCIPELSTKCKEYLRTVFLGTSNPTSIFEHLHANETPALKKAVRETFALNLPHIVTKPVFLKLNVKQVCSVLSHDSLAVDSEKEVFEAAAAWLGYIWHKRKRFVGEVLACVRFPFMTDEHVLDIYEKPEHIMVLDTPECQQSIIKALLYRAAVRVNRPVSFPPLVQPRLSTNNKNKDQTQKDLCLSKPNNALVAPHHVRQAHTDPNCSVKQQSRKHVKICDGFGESSSCDNVKEADSASQINVRLADIQWSSDLETSNTETRKKKNYLQQNSFTYPDRITGGQSALLSVHKAKAIVNLPNHKKTHSSEKVLKVLSQRPGSPKSLAGNGYSQDYPNSFSVHEKGSSDSLGRHGDNLLLPAAHFVSSTSCSTSWFEAHKKEEGNHLSQVKKTVSMELVCPSCHAVFKGGAPKRCHVDQCTSPMNKGKAVPCRRTKSLQVQSSEDDGSSRSVHFSQPDSTKLPDGLSILVLGGINPMDSWDAHVAGRQMFQMNPKDQSPSWTTYDSMPYPRHLAAVVSLDNNIYVIGGCDPQKTNNGWQVTALRTTLCYNLSSGKWTTKSNMAHGRINHAVVVFNKNIYAIAGLDDKSQLLASVERYDPSKDLWVKVCPLNTPRMGLCATAYRGAIWTCGGISYDSRSKTRLTTTMVEVYIHFRDMWLVHSTVLRQPRCFSILIVWGDMLVLAGGATSVLHGGEEVLKSTCSIDIFTDAVGGKWTRRGALTIKRHSSAAVVFGQFLYIIGGSTSFSITALSDVERIDLATFSAQNVSNLPIPLSGLGAVVIPDLTYRKPSRSSRTITPSW